MPPAISQAGVPLPLPDAFDYVAWMTPPPDVDILVLMDVKTRNKRNIVIDTFNSTSIDITRAYMEAAQDGTRAAGQDVGPNLKAYFRYTEDELETLVVDNDYFSLSAAPEKNRRKKKKADDEKAKSKGLLKSLVMANPVQLSAASHPPPNAPEILLVPLRYRTPLPIWWFTNARLRFATEQLRGEGSFMDITKLTKEWGGDDTTESNSLYTWAEAALNYTNAFKSLSVDANDLNPHTYGGELEKHFAFFKNVDDAEELFDVQGVVLAYKAAKLLSSSSASLNSLRLSDVGKPPSSQSSRNSSSNREGPRERGGGRRDRDRFRDHSRERSRERNEDRRYSNHRNGGGHGGDNNDFRPTICVICGEDTSKLKIANPHQDRDTDALCVAFNLLWDCDGLHKSKGLHICSFCGGDHAALSFHKNCHRACNGKLRT
ncbi:hypothetical protein B0H14DRAFT_3579982 [Mycena olivaceomarginata]|nr:hypothetical protein B0H14DRAFT_3579982 [Mycena olivaceomarginata]